MELNGQLPTPATLPPGKEPSHTHWIGGWIRPRACLDAMAKRKNLCPCRESNSGRLAHGIVTILTEILRLLYYDV